VRVFAGALGLALGLNVGVAAASDAPEDRAERRPPVVKREPEASEPYSVPWQLRPVVAPTVVRVDASLARYEDGASTAGTTAVGVLTVAARIPETGPPTTGVALVFRTAVLHDSAPNGARRGDVVNPLFGVTYAAKLQGGLRLNGFFGVSVPTGGDTGPDAGSRAARANGATARAQFDNALFATRDVAVAPGVAAAWVRRGLTAQLEATLFHLVRARGGPDRQPEATKTNFVAGAHAGYFFTPWLSAGAELRYQRWINAPFAVEADPTGASRDAACVAVGPRLHLPLVPGIVVRPGLAYHRFLDLPFAGATPNYQIVQFDLPIFFI
jgi:hypothetical protein